MVKSGRKRLCVVAITCLAALRGYSQPEIDFTRDIQPIFAERCYECHGSVKQRGGLRLDTRDSAMKGGFSGPTIIARDADRSPLIRRVLGLDGEDRMPAKGDPLSDAQIQLLKDWIARGALWPDSAAGSDAKTTAHWSFVKPHPLTPPNVVTAGWCINEIDRFVAAKLDESGLKPAAVADRTTLLRRVCLDLAGLPPTLEQTDRFLNDSRPDAYERVVDELLASPQYGERWARPWLDLARYADSNGYEKDRLRSMWPYRDWVIRALNADMPFDQFTLEQIAGDMLPGATIDQKIASGFHRNTLLNEEGGVDPEEFRTLAVVDRVNTTATVWLGATIACAQCHNHKFDPFSQKEYYQLSAFFNNTVEETARDPNNEVAEVSPRLRVPLPNEAELVARAAELEQALAAHTPEQDAAIAAWELQNRGSVDWTVQSPKTVTSTGGQDATRLADNSILFHGEAPERDTCSITVESSLQRITAIRLEVLTHPTLGHNGPGRASHGNFVLSEFRAAIAANERATPTPIRWDSAIADFEQTARVEWRVAHTIDGDPQSGWAIEPEFGQPHVAIYVLKAPIERAAGRLLTITLEQNYGTKHLIGRARISLTDDSRDPRRDARPQTIRDILVTPAALRTDELCKRLADYYRSIAPELRPIRDELASLRKKLAAAPTTLVMQELATPRETFVLKRGSFLDRGERVEPDVPAVLHPWPTGAPRNRIGLARWLVSAENPLVARVTVNRIWEQYFGFGIVRTSEDFGTQGEPPSNPALLDWLATEFVRGGWRLKPIHRLIVTSATYRQSSNVTPELHERDPHNRLLARGPRFRLEAELLRDQALAVSGLLSLKMGGPSVMPFQPPGVWSAAASDQNNLWVTSGGDDRWRRGIYTFWRRSSPYASFVAFDAPNRELLCTRRSRTNTPLQALTTLNDPEFVTPAAALARLIIRDGGAAPRERIAYAMRCVLARPPRDDELQRLMLLLDQQIEHYRQAPSAAAQLADSGLGPPAEGMDTAELAAWTIVANVVLNLDETLTKG